VQHEDFPGGHPS